MRWETPPAYRSPSRFFVSADISSPPEKVQRSARNIRSEPLPTSETVPRVSPLTCAISHRSLDLPAKNQECRRRLASRKERRIQFRYHYCHERIGRSFRPQDSPADR